MKVRHLFGACALCMASAVQGEATFHPTQLAALPPRVTAELATIDAWTIGQTVGYMLFSPGKVHKVWPDYGYDLSEVMQANPCTAEKLTSQSDFWLGDVSLVAKVESADKYQGVALYPMAEASYITDDDKTFSWASSHLDKNEAESLEFTFGDFCHWLKGTDYNELLTAMLEEQESGTLLIVTDRVLPGVDLSYDRFEIQPTPHFEQWNRVLQNWQDSATRATPSVAPE